MGVVGTVNGMDSLADMLRALPDKVKQDKSLARGLKKGAGVIRAQAKGNLAANGDVDSGRLANEMTISQKKESVPGLVEVVLKPSSKLTSVVRKDRWSKEPVPARPSKYAHWIEEGFLHKVENGTEEVPAHPFMRPAVDTKRDEALRVIEESVQADIDREAQQLGLK